MATHKDRILLRKGQEIDGYTITSLLGQGGFGDVYKVTDFEGSQFAMKTEYLDAPKRALKAEVKIMKNLHSPCFPKVYTDGETDNVYYLVMELLGPSIGDIRRAHQNYLTSEFTFNFAIQSLEVIHKFHQAGYIHRDIKPSNFLIKRDQEYPIMLIDFGLSKQYIDFETQDILPPTAGHYIGTKKYASLNAHKKNDLGRCDDLNSWFYTLLEMKKGRLPWRNVKELEDVAKMKEKQTDALIKSYPELIRIQSYLKKLSFSDEPDYDYLKSIITNEMESKGYFPEHFDWIQFYDQETNEDEEEEEEDNKENRETKPSLLDKNNNADDENNNNEKDNNISNNNNNSEEHHDNNENSNPFVEEPDNQENETDSHQTKKKNKKDKKKNKKKNKKTKKSKKSKKSKKTKNRGVEGNDDGDDPSDSDEGKCCLIS